jgi:hypothetical protein
LDEKKRKKDKTALGIAVRPTAKISKKIKIKKGWNIRSNLAIE